MNAVVGTLREVDLLEGVDDAALTKLTQAARQVRLRAGEALLRQGEYGESFFVLLEGEVVLQVVGADGRLQEVGTYGPGEYVGELALIRQGERSASADCRTSVVAVEIRQAAFWNALKKFKAVRKRLESVATDRALEVFFRQSRYFQDLPEAARSDLVKAATLETYGKSDVIIAEGDAPDRFFAVREGFVRVSRAAGDDSEILAYLGAEDFFGDQEILARDPGYSTTVVAVEPVQCIAVPAQAFLRAASRHKELLGEFRRYEIRRRKQQQILKSSPTAMGFVKDVLEQGLGQARSALIINLDTCVRCGNCVQACDDLHGYSRLARRGKAMTRRVDLDKTQHEHLYFPTSCLQCAAPECMVGCPTGAISRDPGGEVFIRDTCIGCGSCARNCDFGNISMAKASVEGDSWLLDTVRGAKEPAAEDNKPELIAVKCDVCFERQHAACVYNCPTQAVLRIDPRSYFEEIARIAPKASLPNEEAGAKTVQRRGAPPWLTGAIQLAAMIVSVLIALAGWRSLSAGAPDGVGWSWDGSGWYAGVAAAVVMVLLASLGGRKRMRTRRLGPLHRWIHWHAVLGGVFYGLVLFHAGFGASSGLTATLLALVTFICAVGVGGQLANGIIPRLLARTEDEALLPEDIAPRIRGLEEANVELLASLDDGERARVEARVARLSRGVWRCFIRGHSPKQISAHVAKMNSMMSAMAEDEAAFAVRVAEDTMVRRLLLIRRALEILMTSWVPVHLVASCLAVLLTVGHILTVLLW